MKENHENYYMNNIIDIRNSLETLLKYKWWIIILTFLSALLVFLISAYLIPPVYQASAYVVIREPFIDVELDPSIRSSIHTPDTSALVELADSENIKSTVQRIIGEDEIGDNRLEMKSYFIGKSQIKMEVTSTNQELAEFMANTWSELLVKRINELYGVGKNSLETLEGEVEDAQEDWEIAQDNLETYLPNSKLEIYEIQLSATKGSLSDRLKKIDNNKLLINDAQALLSQLSSADDTAKLYKANALSIIALKQRAVGGISEIQFQIQGDDILGEEYLIIDGRNEIEELITSLQEQNEELIRAILPIEKRIAELSGLVEFEKNRYFRLTQKRNLSRDTYFALVNYLEEVRIVLSQDNNYAQVGAPAILPEKPIDTKIMINTGLAGLSGFLITSILILTVSWWNKGKDD